MPHNRTPKELSSIIGTALLMLIIAFTIFINLEDENKSKEELEREIKEQVKDITEKTNEFYFRRF